MGKLHTFNILLSPKNNISIILFGAFRTDE